MTQDLETSITTLRERAKAGDIVAFKALQDFVARSRTLRIAKAREDPSTFLAYVMKDERSGQSISLAPYHRHLQDFLSDDSGSLGCYKGILGHVECGKTMNVTVGRVLWELGRNPNLRIAVVMATKEKSKDTIRIIAEYLENSRELREVFPHLGRSKRRQDPWNKTQLTVERSAPIRDPSVQGLGIGSNILGARLDLVILDDALTAVNTLSPRSRKGVLDYIVGTLAGRVGRLGRMWFIANAWHPEDAWHVLTKHRLSGGFSWKSMTLPVAGPVIVKDHRGPPRVVCGEDGVSNWPGRWTPEYLELKTGLFGGEDHPETARLLYCQARSDDAARFKRAWIDAALSAGANIYGDAMSVQSFDAPPGWKVFSGLDLGVKKHLGADLTVLFHLVGRPDGMVQVLGIESDRSSAPDTLRRTFDAHKRYNSTIIVETVGAQDYIKQLAKDPDVSRALGRVDADRLPIHPFTTRGNGTVGNKHSAQFGVEAIGAEMATGRWIIPCVKETAEDGKTEHTRVHPEIEAWIQDMLYYDPHGHMGDRLAACWFAHNGVRRRTFGWQVDFADAPPEERSKHWAEISREERERREQMSREERQREHEEHQRQQQQAQIDSAWGDFDW